MMMLDLILQTIIDNLILQNSI